MLIHVVIAYISRFESTVCGCNTFYGIVLDILHVGTCMYKVFPVVQG